MYPDFLPTSVQNLEEATSIRLTQQILQKPIATPLSDRPIATTYINVGSPGPAPPFLLLHGFDSSLLEFRRLVPQLAPQRQTWALDLLGFGFSDRSVSLAHDPGAIKLHLHGFWQQLIDRPIVLVGASMGGAAAIDFALTYPACVAGLVLIDSAGFAAGPAMGKLMFPPLDSWATAFLRHPAVRRQISRSAYYNPALVTPDAELCAALHLQCPGWKEALIAFTKSGGYNFLAPKIGQLTCPTLIVWGDSDRILGIKDAERFAATIAFSQLRWIPQAGHVPHLEKPAATAAAMVEFCQQLANREP